MHGKKEPEEINDLIRADIHHDIYVIGTEECARSIAKATLMPSKKGWVGKLTKTLGDRYIMLNSHSLVGTHLVIFVHAFIFPFVSEVKTASLATGILNSVGNKGGVGISFKVGETSLLCINCHLPSG